MKPSLVVLAAGISSRYGRPKQLEPVGPGGEALFDYAIWDARLAGFGDIAFVIRRDTEVAFREHVLGRWAGVPVSFAIQELSGAAGLQGSGRRKPWGTGHAVLAAQELAVEPFGVINADDFYGRAAYAGMAQQLGSLGVGEARFAIAGYSLRATLSRHGGVSRAVCQVAHDGSLERITELVDVRATAAGVQGTAPDGGTRRLDGNEMVSMNLWGLTPAVFPLLRDLFTAFLGEHGSDPAAEFRLSTAVDELVRKGMATVRVFGARAEWMGLTHTEDRAHVTARLCELVEARVYPPRLAMPTRPVS